MDFEQMISSTGLWIASSFMVIAVVLQAAVFLRTSLKEAKRLGIKKESYKSSMRASVITALGPACAPVIVILSMMAVVGGPTTWMRLSDVGAAGTELSMVSAAAGVAGAEVGTESFGGTAFVYSLWMMALNNFGWLIVVFLLNHRMSGVVAKMNEKLDPKWVKFLLGGAALGLFAYLLTSSLVGKAGTEWLAAGVSSAVMLLLTSVFKKYKRLQEFSLGISLLAGMFTAQLVMG